MSRRNPLVPSAVALAFTGCVGLVGDPGSSPVNMPPGMPPGMPPTSTPDVCAAGEVPGSRLVRRLTAPQFESTVRAVFGLDATAWPGPTLPPDPASSDGFTNDADRLRINTGWARSVRESARDVATRVSAAPNLARVLPCASAAADEACARTYLSTVGRALFHRALTAAESARYMALHTSVAASQGFPTFVRYATEALLQSPNVVWRTEIGTTATNGRFRLAPTETATLLAYAYTGRPPTAALLTRAEAGDLNMADGARAAARAMVLDDGGAVRPEFRAEAMTFFSQWLGLSALPNVSRNAELYPDFTPAVRDSMGREIETFLDDVAFQRRGNVADLMTTRRTFVDATLARFYGFGTGRDATFVSADRPTGWGAGLIAQGALLVLNSNARITSPTRRGVMVRERLLCHHMPAPPPNVGDLPMLEITAGTTRQRYEELHAQREPCVSCHRLMDPIGFGLESLDAIGRRRDHEGQFPIDDSGELRQTSRGNLTFRGPDELATRVSELPETGACIAAYAASYTFGLPRTTATCAAADARAALAGGASLVDFWIQLAGSARFRERE